MISLRQIDGMPSRLLSLEASRLHEELAGPTLFHLPGRRDPGLFVSVLLHGNETVGWDAVRQLLAEHASPLPRALTVLVGNVAAAARGMRRLADQPDYNRVWPSEDDPGDTPEHALMREIVDTMGRRGLFASVDIHNNTGINPHYACINALDSRSLQLATLFGRTVVYFLRPRGVQSLAMGQICPAVTLECGKVGQIAGVDHAGRYLDACLRLSEIPSHPVAPGDIDLFHTVAVVRVRPETLFGFGEVAEGVRFAQDLDRMNFRELVPGASIGEVATERPDDVLEVIDEGGQDVTERYFAIQEGSLQLRLPVMPSMFTTDPRIIRQDCLGYLMERCHLPELRECG